MSTPQKTHSANDVFSDYQENTDKIFTNVKRSVPQYHQSFTNVQQEYLQAVETIVGSTIKLQKEYAEKVGISTYVPKATLQMINSLAEGFMKINSMQNQVILATIDATQQNIRTFNTGTKSFADLNRNIIQSFVPIFTTKGN